MGDIVVIISIVCIIIIILQCFVDTAFDRLFCKYNEVSRNSFGQIVPTDYLIRDVHRELTENCVEFNKRIITTYCVHNIKQNMSALKALPWYTTMT